MGLPQVKQYSGTNKKANLSRTIRKYALEAIWLKDTDELKHHVTSLNSEIASICGKSPSAVSLKDINRVLSEIEDKSQKLDLGKINFDSLEKIYLKYKTASPYIDIASSIYSLAMAINGHPGPIVRKLFIKSSNTVNANYVALTYLAGQISVSLYSDDINLEEISEFEPDPIDSFDPIFKLLNEEHIKDLARLLKLSIDVNLSLDDARLKIINELCYHGSNKVKYIYNKTVGNNTTTYKSILVAICSDFKIGHTTDTEIEKLEEKIIMRVLQDTINSMEFVEFLRQLYLRTEVKLEDNRELCQHNRSAS